MSHATHLPPARRPWPLRHSIGLLLLEAALLTGAIYYFANAWVGVGLSMLGVAVALLILLPLSSGRSMGHMLQRRWAYGSRKPRADVRPDELRPLAEWIPELDITTTQTGRGEPIGLAFDGDAWIAVLAVVDDDEIIADGGAELDLTALDELTAFDDIVFDGLQVITHFAPAPATRVLGDRAPAVLAYQELGTPVPPSVCSTWIAVRLDPRRCLPAVTRRGPSNHEVGPEGPMATLRFGVHRVQSQLKLRGVTTRLVDAEELTEVLARTTGTAEESRTPDGPASDEDWELWSCDGFVHAAMAVRDWGHDVNHGHATLLALAMQSPVMWGVVSYTARHGNAASGAIRLVDADDDLVIETLDGVCDQAEDSGIAFESPGGMAVPGMLSTVPLGRGWWS